MSLAEDIRNGLVEVNPHMTSEQRKAFEAHVEFFDRVVAEGMAQVEAECRELIAAGLMTENGKLTEKAREPMPPNVPGEGYWLMEMERESLPGSVTVANRRAHQHRSPPCTCCRAGRDTGGKGSAL